MEPTKLADRLPAPERIAIPEKVRARMAGMLAEARKFEQMANEVFQTFLDVAGHDIPAGKVPVLDPSLEHFVLGDNPNAPPPKPLDAGTLPQEAVSQPVPSTPGA